MLKFKNDNLKLWNNKLKVAGIMLGICLLTGSLCACGDDSNAVISLEELSQTHAEENGESTAETSEQAATEETQSAAEETISESENNDQTKETEGSVSAEETQETVAAEESVEEVPEEISITISAAGDVTLGNYPEQGYYLSLPYTYEEYQDDSYFFENV